MFCLVSSWKFVVVQMNHESCKLCLSKMVKQLIILNMERLLYEASVEGNPTVLQMLLQKDPLILDTATLNCSDDMPLHIASMLGHKDFVNEILTRKPKLSMECDSQRRLSLHIASAKGHVDIVKALLSANPEACLASDRDGRNPLHLAAVKGHCEVVKELVRTQPHAARAMVQQETILHLCVKHNQLEVLKLLVETVGDHEFVNTKDADGNTILHLAVADKQIETINFLLLNTTIEVNASNMNGETLMDILAKGPRDVKDKQIIQALAQAGVVEAENESLFPQVPQNCISKMAFGNLKYYRKLNIERDLKNNGDWLDKKRNALMVVASLIATMAFQAGTNPPSGVWQDDSTADPPHKAGYAVMWITLSKASCFRVDSDGYYVDCYCFYVVRLFGFHIGFDTKTCVTDIYECSVWYRVGMEVVKELVQAKPHAARGMVHQETILHLCVKHNQLEVLKLLIE
ncbi:hypothetical protein L1987_14453 [Smallanthus sonchifolius]|uniref:Uncharacterized protein n=1 Tax=Smallanthus sonchifolius TaxID=185202 RepID=A0ACB9J2X5_9ASTR|nr:hypothetical protein L1987_14453 [Smallanthus sonchifolius]